MMHNGAYGWYMGYGWLFQILIFLLFLLVLWWVLRGQQQESAHGILSKRFAKGEITEKEYRRLKKELDSE